jgi:hypothetical protein
MRLCRKSGCSDPGAASCYFSYDSREIWITELRLDPEPTCYDLCEDHAHRFGAPIGWTLHDLRGAAESAGPLAS